MKCSLYRLMSTLAESPAAAAEGGWLAFHSARCPACRAWRGRRARLASLLRETLRDEVRAYSPRAAIHLSAEPLARPARRLRPAFLWAPALAAAALAAVLAGRTGPHHLAPERQAAVQPHTLRQPRREELPAPAQPSRDQRIARALRRPVRRAPMAGVAAAADARYLDGRDEALFEIWSGRRREARGLLWRAAGQLRGVTDDFVRIPLPRVAALPGKAGRAALAEAAAQAEKEAKVVDTRLFRRVSVARKAASLDEICADLERQTGVALRASRGVREEKATVFVKERPARELMRALSRLFGFFWSRSGEEGAYRYELSQDLRSRLAEEELRNHDQNAALLALDDAMEAYRPYLGMTPQQLKARMVSAREPEKSRLKKLVEDGGWGGLQLYAKLSPAERLALRNGQQIRLSVDAPDADHRIPPEMVQPLLATWNRGVNLGTTNGLEFWRGSTPLTDAPGATPSVGLRMNRSELGQLTLESALMVDVPVPGHEETKGNASSAALAIGKSPSVADPQNAAANAALRGDPALRPTVSLKPAPVCPMGRPPELDPSRLSPPELPRTGLTTAEVWEEVHRATGLPIVADFYTRLYPADAVAVPKATIFDALCRTGDAVGARWHKDGDFILARSTSYYWDKLKEVPNSLLRRWQADEKAADGLPLDDLLEMTTLSDVQLDSITAAEGILHYWGIREWPVVAGPNQLRPYARFVAGLTRPQKERIASERGLAFTELSLVQQQELLRVEPTFTDPRLMLPPEMVPRARLWLVYCPAGWYWWAPVDSNGSLQVRDVFLAGRTEAEVLDRARRLDPAVPPAQVRRSEGDLVVYGRVGDLVKFGRSRTHGFLNVLQPPPNR